MSDYICSVCGGDVQLVSLTVNPPIPQYTCLRCGRVRQDKPRIASPTVIEMDP